jgi:uncharacterized protein YqeY
MKTFKNTNEIRQERLANRANKTIYNLLGVLLGELDRRPNQNSPITEQDIYKTIKKLYDAAIECGNTEEKEYLEDYICKTMSSVELTMIIDSAVRNGTKDFGSLMKMLNENYPNRVDKKMAANIIRKYIS